MQCSHTVEGTEDEQLQFSYFRSLNIELKSPKTCQKVLNLWKKVSSVYLCHVIHWIETYGFTGRTQLFLDSLWSPSRKCGGLCQPSTRLCLYWCGRARVSGRGRGRWRERERKRGRHAGSATGLHCCRAWLGPLNPIRSNSPRCMVMVSSIRCLIYKWYSSLI